MRFQSRRAAGRELAVRLAGLVGEGPVVVVALPRGGVDVALPIARDLQAPLDVCVTRKIGFPGHRELAIGALTAAGTVVLDEAIVERFRVDRRYLTEACETLAAEARRLESVYGIVPADRDARWRDQTVVVADDGSATGWTAVAACREIRRAAPARLVVAVPVLSAGAYERLRAEADDVVAIEVDESFHAVGAYYDDFHQLTDAEVKALLLEARAEERERHGARGKTGAGGSVAARNEGRGSGARGDPGGVTSHGYR